MKSEHKIFILRTQKLKDFLQMSYKWIKTWQIKFTLGTLYSWICNRSINIYYETRYLGTFVIN